MKQIKMVRDLMYESPPTVGPHESLGNAGRLMMESRQKRLAVVDEGGRLVGLISDRDLRLAADSPLLEESASEMLDTLQNHHVREIMTTAVHTIEAEAPVVEAAQLMRVAEVGLPVVEYDESGNDEMLVGMITQQQLLDYLIVLLSDEEP